MSNALVNGLAGAGGGIIAQIITYPLQTVNTRQQTERIAKKTTPTVATVGGDLPSSGREKDAVPHPSYPYSGSGTIYQMLQLIKTEGWGGLYSGLKPSLVGTAASQGIYYYFYQVFKNKAEAVATARKKKGLGDGTVGMFSWLVVAAAAGSLNVLLTNPIWVLVTRMQVTVKNIAGLYIAIGHFYPGREMFSYRKTHTQAERKIMEARKEAVMRECASKTDMERELVELDLMKPRPYGTLQAVREVYREAGVKGFWKGLVPTLIMVCNPSIQFMIYETSLKRLRSKRSGNTRRLKNVTALEVFFLGALAKLGATVATYPLLVVKSRLQAKQEIGKNAMARYTGTLDAIVKMIRYEGLRGFYKGMGTKIVQSVFAASVLFMVKEEFVKAFLYLADESKKVHLKPAK